MTSTQPQSTPAEPAGAAHTAAEPEINRIKTAQAEGAIFDLGALACHWQPAGQEPVLWNSDPVTQGVYPTRGGVPVCFPWFAAGRSGQRKPNHGLVRTAKWKLVSCDEDTGNVTYRISSEEADRVISAEPAYLENTSTWVAQLEVEFKDSFSVCLAVTNTGETDFTFEAALHTYLAVSDVRNVIVAGLEADPYLDTTLTPPRVVKPSEGEQAPVAFGQMVDRVYESSATVRVEDPGWGRVIEVSKTGSANTVVWNPGPEAGATTSGVGSQRWHEFVCVEAANCKENEITVPAGGTWVMSQTLRVLPYA
ncbi:MAG: D-hexose-6-phosphate mutarotase [Actinomycetaceae bacterium]|nr:D-hexose-6-phosphate mutarotase [Actinomycetaceae bacterium]